MLSGQEEARTFTLKGTELYWNLFSSLEGRLQQIASHQPSGLHHKVPQDPDPATTTRKVKGVSVFLSAVLVLGESVLDLFTEENGLEEAWTLLEQADRGRCTFVQDLVQELSDTNENLSDQTCNFFIQFLIIMKLFIGFAKPSRPKKRFCLKLGVHITVSYVI